MPAWSVIVRGILYRPGRSLVVALLVMVATATAVAIPAYTRAAQQSVLTDTLTAQPPFQVGITTRTTRADHDSAVARTRALLAGQPTLAGRLGAANTAVELEVIVPEEPEEAVPGEPVITQFPLVWRGEACRHLVLVAGACPVRPDQVLVSDRAARHLRSGVGQRVRLHERIPNGIPVRPLPPTLATITGLYDPTRNLRDPFWGSGNYFGSGYDPRRRIYSLDSAFVAVDAPLFGRAWPPSVSVEYPLRLTGVRLSDVPALRSGIVDATARGTSVDLAVESSLPLALTRADRQESALARSVPLVALPLVVLCLFVLFVVAAAVTEERGPEIALGRLRGLRATQLGGFGVGEPLLLVLLAAPFGLGLGLAATEAAARIFLAPTAHAEPTAAVLVAAGAAVLGAALSIALAGRRTVRAGVLAQLRRVPPRSARRAAAVEAAIGALAVAALVQVIAGDDRGTPLAYAAPPLVALVAGLLAARLLNWWARARGRRAAARGRLAPLLSAASLARRPATGRVAALLTVAVALLTFGATGWDVAAGNREITARATVGAPLVYRVTAPNPGALLAAVRQADPGGKRAMAVVRRFQFYGEGDTTMVGVDADRLAAVAVWPGGDSGTLAAVAGKLRHDAAPPLLLRGPTITVDATATRLQHRRPMSLALLMDGGDGPRTLGLGQVAPGAHTYAGELTGCAGGCRVMALAVRRFPGDAAPIGAELTVRAVRDAAGPVEAGLATPGGWRAQPAIQPGQRLSAIPGGDGLRISLDSTAPSDPVVEYADTPAELPGVLAGPAPAEDAAADVFAFAAFGSAPDVWRVADRHPALPGAGDRALLFDLETELHQAARAGLAAGGRSEFEVWATGPPDPGLPGRLAAGGVQVVSERSLVGRRVELGRLAPALALRLYLAAGAIALLLAIGTLLLTAAVGVRARIGELAALRVVGVPRATLRRSLREEYAGLLGAAILVGAPAGLAGAALLLPAIPMVSIDADALAPVYRPAGLWVPGAVALLLCCLAGTVLAAPRVVRRAEPRLAGDARVADGARRPQSAGVAGGAR